MRHCFASIDPTNPPPETEVPVKLDLKGLKIEASRLYLRTFKKIGKVNEKLSADAVEDSESLKIELAELKTKLALLGNFEDSLKELRSASDPRFHDLTKLAMELGVSDQPPARPVHVKKPKGKQPPPRKPYHEYLSKDGITIRVGRGASDNDILSCDPLHRDSSDWWLHVSGFAGSHVVIRSHDDDLPQKYPETLYDAAILAAVNSKAPQSRKITVSFVRCRQVSKPPGAKAGLVRLNGDIGLLPMHVSSEGDRLKRLEAAKFIAQ